MQKTIWFLESEIDLLKLAFSQKRLVPTSEPNPNKSKVYFIPKPKGLGIIGLGEIATSLQLTDEFFDENGEPSALIHISEALQEAFNHKEADIYKSKSTVFRRKPYNRTKAMDYLKTLIVREYRKIEKEKMKKDEFLND